MGLSLDSMIRIENGKGFQKKYNLTLKDVKHGFHGKTFLVLIKKQTTNLIRMKMQNKYSEIIISQRDIQKFARDYNKDHKVKLPTNPNIVYKQWKGLNDFLGTGIWLSYNEVKKLIKGKFASRKEYAEFIAKNPQKYPSESHFQTTKEWKSWGDFLGTGYISTQW